MSFNDLFSKGKFSYKNGNFKRAKHIYKDIIKLYPKHQKTLNNLALCYIKLNKIDKAIECLEKSIEINKENELIWNNLGKAYYHKGDYTKVLDTYKEASKIFPKNAFFWEGMGVAYSHIGDMDNAIKVYKNALDLNNKSISSWFNLCMAYSKKGIEFNPNQFSPNTDVSWYFLAKELLYNGLYLDTLDACERALAINPSFNAVFILKNKTKKIMKASQEQKITETKISNQKISEDNIEKDPFYEKFQKIKSKKNRLISDYFTNEKSSLDQRFRKAQEKLNKRIMDLDQSTNGEITEDDNVNESKKQKELQKKPKDDSDSKKIDVKLTVHEKLKHKYININNKYYNSENCNFVIDGANVARDSKDNNHKGKISNLYLLTKKLNSIGIKNYKVICDRSLFYTIDSQEEYAQLMKNDSFIETPGGTEADMYILKYAKEKDAFIISNDMFKEFYKIYGKDWIKNRRITFKFIEDFLFFDKIYTVSQ